MRNDVYDVIWIVGLALFGMALTLIPADSTVVPIPPTNAFSSVLTDHGIIKAVKWNDMLVAPKPPYAQISDGTTQSCISGSAKNVTLNTNDSIYHVTHSTTVRTNEIIIQEAGTYQIIAVPQIGEASVQADGVHDLWMMKNNAKIPNSNIKTSVMLQLATADTMTGTINWVGRLNQNDIISFQQGCTDSDIGLIFTAEGVPPATPSIIVSVAKLNW